MCLVRWEFAAGSILVEALLWHARWRKLHNGRALPRLRLRLLHGCLVERLGDRFGLEPGADRLAVQRGVANRKN
jgi:hypothetical protein